MEHYQRVRRTFEGPSKDQTSKFRLPTPTRIPAPAIDGHVERPVPTTRPPMKSRSSTVKPTVSSASKGKGKAKPTQWDSDDDDDDDAYVTSNDTPVQKEGGVNHAFGDVAMDDDEEIYG